MSSVPLGLTGLAPARDLRVVHRTEVVAARDRRCFALGTLGATLLTAVLCSSTLARAPISYDEAAVASLANGSSGYFNRVVWERELNGGLYLVLMRAWTAVFGVGPVSLRFPSLLCAVATVPLLAVLARKLVGPRFAVLAALALAVNGSFIQSGQLSSGRAMCAALCVVTGLLAFRAVGQPGWEPWLLVGEVAAAAVWCDFFGLLVVAGILVSLLAHPEATRVRRQLLATAALVTVLSGPLLVFVFSDRSQFSGWRSAAIGQHHLLQRSLRFAIGGTPTWLAPALVLLAVATGLAWWRLIVLRRPEPSVEWGYPLALGWLGVPVVGSVIISRAFPILVPAYLVAILPGVGLLVAMAAWSLPGRRARIIVLIAALLFELSSAVTPAPKSALEQWGALARTLGAEGRPGQVVVVEPAYERTTLAYYLRSDRSGLVLEPSAPAGQPAFSLGAGTSPASAHPDWVVVVLDVSGAGPAQGAGAQRFGQLLLERKVNP